MIIQGDNRSVLKSLPANSVDLVCTDPPYEIRAAEVTGFPSRSYLAKIASDNLDNGFDLSLLQDFLRVLKTPNIILFASRLQLRPYLNWAHDRHLNWSLISWHKPHCIPLSHNTYLPDTEYILHFWKNKQLRGTHHTKHRYYVQNSQKSEYPHPTVKPLNIVSNLIENASSSSEVVLDPFAGSGTTLVAAKTLGRKYIGIELKSEYIDIIHARLASVSEPPPLLQSAQLP